MFLWTRKLLKSARDSIYELTKNFTKKIDADLLLTGSDMTEKLTECKYHQRLYRILWIDANITKQMFLQEYKYGF